jgi:hypothetical protein
MQQRCNNCGSPTVPGQRFCGGCGAQLSLSCPVCRITVSPGTRFCPSCGSALGGPPGGMPPQQPAWNQQSGWAPQAERGQTSSARPFLVILLIVLIAGLGFLVYKYTPIGATIGGFFSSSGGGSGETSAGAPVISNVKAVAGVNNARIDWTTDKNSSTQVEYGKTNEYGDVAPDPAADDPASGTSLGVISHSVTITGLEPTSTYHYRVKSIDKDSNEAVSGDKTFTTTEAEATP